MTGYDRRGHITVPTGRGLWVAVSDCDRAGADPLSVEAEAVLAAGLAYPQFGAPDQVALKADLAERAKNSGSKYRPPGRDKIQNALSELRAKGFYGIRRETDGRKVGNKRPQWATIRSFANQPWGHLHELAALTSGEVWWHFRRAQAAAERRLGPATEGVRLDRAG